ncbi:Carboxylesterase type B [Trinorchestia longiramus]|nr:Carboxylesterase type B [Trinorchestia longiramus]
MDALKFLLALLLLLGSLLRISAVAPPDQDNALKLNNPVGYGHHFGHKKTAQGETSKKTQEVPLVNAGPLGTIKGRVLNSSVNHRPFYAFHSIRYALQPERFQYAELFTGPLTADGSVYDATRFRDICPQKSLIVPLITGSEDCLYISVYRPSEDSTEPLPVMVFIHGGAYMSGEAQMYMPTKLLDRDVVVAVLQYRLGTLGFLYSGTTDAPGNMGLMDQITALRWVQNYISYWGGDPDLVTVFGQSAGGASTSLLQLSPLTQARGELQPSTLCILTTPSILRPHILLLPSCP